MSVVSCAVSAGKASTPAGCLKRRRSPRYRRCDFENFQVYPNEKLVNAVSAVRRFAETFPNSS